MMQRLGGEEALQSYGWESGRREKVEIITGLQSRPSHSDERWGVEDRSKYILGCIISFLKALKERSEGGIGGKMKGWIET